MAKFKADVNRRKCKNLVNRTFIVKYVRQFDILN
jgi:hypothetical protein